MSLARYKLYDKKLSYFMKRSSDLKKKIANEKLEALKRNLNLRLVIIKKIKQYKKIKSNYYFFKLRNLKKISFVLDNKINMFKKQKEDGLLKMKSLYKFIKHNKLKKNSILKELNLNIKSVK
jgi:lipopolysaccharide export LptBFGC system permease protein LptF